ncbi:MAG: hypothetical protein Q9180_006655, partial [Flavoplaca navasiana]
APLVAPVYYSIHLHRPILHLSAQPRRTGTRNQHPQPPIPPHLRKPAQMRFPNNTLHRHPPRHHLHILQRRAIISLKTRLEIHTHATLTLAVSPELGETDIGL